VAWIQPESKEMLDAELFVERKDKPAGGIENTDGTLDQFLKKLLFRSEGVKSATEIVKCLQLEKLASEFKSRGRHID
jgi:hypothetical protein